MLRETRAEIKFEKKQVSQVIKNRKKCFKSSNKMRSNESALKKGEGKVFIGSRERGKGWRGHVGGADRIILIIYLLEKEKE